MILYFALTSYDLIYTCLLVPVVFCRFFEIFCIVMSSRNKGSCISFSPIFITFIYFFCLTALTRPQYSFNFDVSASSLGFSFSLFQRIYHFFIHKNTSRRKLRYDICLQEDCSLVVRHQVNW